MVKTYKNANDIPKSLVNGNKVYKFYRTILEDAPTSSLQAVGRKLTAENKEWIVEPIKLIRTDMLAIYVKNKY